MTLREKLTQTPTPGQIALELGIGLMMMTLAVLDGTRFADQVHRHGDGLVPVGLAAVGGLAFGLAIGMARHRAAVPRRNEKESTAHE